MSSIAFSRRLHTQRFQRSPGRPTVVFTGDVMRPGPQGQYEWQNLFTSMFYRALAPFIKTAVDADVRLVIAGSGQDCIGQDELYQDLGIPFTARAWMPVFLNAVPLTAAAEERLLNHYGNVDLVVCFELPPILRSFFDKHAIRYLDLGFGPAQFFDDYTLVLASNDLAIMDALARYNITEEQYLVWAGIAQATCLNAKIEKEDAPGRSVLFCANTSTDRNLCSPKGEYLTFMDYAPKVRELVSGHETIYFKPHPYGFCALEELEFFKGLGNVRFTNKNIYWLMSTIDNMTHVVSLCSSSAMEARYFGKAGMNLVRAPTALHHGQEPADDYSDTHIAVIHDVWKTSFWKNVLGTVFATKREDVDLSVRSNRLRHIFRAAGPAALFDAVPQEHYLAYYHFCEQRPFPDTNGGEEG